MTKKPDLDEATVEITRRMLSTPPKSHGAMKLVKPTNPMHTKRKRKTNKKAKPSR